MGDNKTSTFDLLNAAYWMLCKALDYSGGCSDEADCNTLEEIEDRLNIEKKDRY